MLVESIAFLGAGWLGGYLFARSGIPWPGAMPRSVVEDAPAPAPASLPTLEEEIARALRQGLPLALFTLAWEAPDGQEKSQRLLESLLHRLLRPYDAIVPSGDGCFVLVLPQVGMAAADAVASRLMQELASLASMEVAAATPLPRVLVAAPASVAQLMTAIQEAAAQAACWRGPRGQQLRIGLAIVDRSAASQVVPRAATGG